MYRFDKKGYGRIFIRKEEDRKKVIKIIQEVDPFEAEYFSNEIVAVLDQAYIPVLVFLHKFEIDINRLTMACWQKDIWIWCVSFHCEPTTKWWLPDEEQQA